MRSFLIGWKRTASSGAFFTRWSWIATLPFAISVMGGYDQAQSADERLTGLAIALGVHLVAGAVGLLAAAGERATSSPRIRVAIVMTTLTVIAVGRPILLSGIAELLQVELFTGPLLGRILTNVLADTIALSIVAMVTVSVRTHRSASQRLRAVLGALDEQRSHDVADVSELSALVLRTTRNTVIGAMPSAAPQPVDPERGALLLERFADDVVRPASHRLFDETSSRYRPAATDLPRGDRQEPNSRPGPTGDDPRDLIRDLRPAPVWLTAISYAALWLPYVVARTPLLVSAAAPLAAVLVGAAGNYLAQVATRNVDHPPRTRHGG